MLLFFIACVLASCQKAPEAPANAAFAPSAETESSAYDLTRIQEAGELIVATLNGPESYYEYHGRPLGLQYYLAEHFAQRVGVRLRVELYRDSAELCEALAAAEVDVVAYPLPLSYISAHRLVASGATADGGKLSWAVRGDTPELAKALKDWYTPDIARQLTRQEQTQQRERRQVRRRVRARYLSRAKGIISEYDAHFKAASRVTGWDWKLLAAQCYQESGFDPEAVSWAGAQGLMQIMPATARHLGLSPERVHDPAENVAAAARYIRELSQSFREIRDGGERIKFVLAAYNGGYYHIRDAMALCSKHGQDPTRWDNVSRYVLGLSSPRYYRDPVVKHGYMIGNETYNYVSAVMDIWRSYGGVPGSGPGVASGAAYSEPKRATKRNRYAKKVEILRPTDAAFSEVEGE